ncbi:hypothetical protein GFS33_09345 [Sulfolobus sp. E11-6]|nr:hypothetical protein GFS33_09345 [Sulfolobus sp. E11-6]
MVVCTCSYRDVWCYYHTDIVVRWFLGEPKSEIHRRAKRLKMEIKDVFKKYVKELETRHSINNFNV